MKNGTQPSQNVIKVSRAFMQTHTLAHNYQLHIRGTMEILHWCENMLIGQKEFFGLCIIPSITICDLCINNVSSANTFTGQSNRYQDELSQCWIMER